MLHPQVEGKFTGNKRAVVMEIVKAAGSQGSTPKEIDKVFSQRGIARSRNLIYNTLSLMVQQGKLKRADGRYIASSSAGKSTPFDKLIASGFRSDDISILAPDQKATHELATEKNTKAPEVTSTRRAAPY
jgi:hypothetical protein